MFGFFFLINKDHSLIIFFFVFEVCVDMNLEWFIIYAESGDLLNYILKKHDAEGEEQLGQSQFAQLLQSVIQDLADALTKKNVIVMRKIKVINGSRLKKVRFLSFKFIYFSLQSSFSIDMLFRFITFQFLC